MGDAAEMRLGNVHPPRFACDMNLQWSGHRTRSRHSGQIGL